MRTGIAAALAMLTACSQQPEAREEATNAAAPVAQRASAPATPARDLRGSGLTGTVSALAGDISALQVRITDRETIVDLAADVLFAFDSAELSPAATPLLQRTAGLIAQGRPGDILVVGHTDAKGEEAYNQDLSLRRAQAVAAWLATNGTDPNRLKPSGRGETEPVASNARPDGGDDPEGRARNRRVEVRIPR